MPVYLCFGVYEDLQQFLDHLGDDCEEMGYSHLAGELRIRIDMEYKKIKEIAAIYGCEVIFVKA